MSLRTNITLHAVLLIALAFPLSAHATLISLGYTSTASSLTIDITGGKLTKDITYSVSNFTTSDNFWKISSFTVNEEKEIINDSLTISGTIQHLKPPPGHGAEGAGDPITITGFMLDTSNAMGSPLQVSDQPDMVSSDHKDVGNHKDNITSGLITAAVSSSLGIKTMEDYNGSLTIKHCADNTPNNCFVIGTSVTGTIPFSVPEPSSLSILGIAVILSLIFLLGGVRNTRERDMI